MKCKVHTFAAGFLSSSDSEDEDDEEEEEEDDDDDSFFFSSWKWTSKMCEQIYLSMDMHVHDYLSQMKLSKIHVKYYF